MTKFEFAILALIPVGGETRVFDLARRHYAVNYPNKAQRAAVSRACWRLYREHHVIHYFDSDYGTTTWGRIR